MLVLKKRGIEVMEKGKNKQEKEMKKKMRELG